MPPRRWGTPAGGKAEACARVGGRSVLEAKADHHDNHSDHDPAQAQCLGAASENAATRRPVLPHRCSTLATVASLEHCARCVCVCAVRRFVSVSAAHFHPQAAHDSGGAVLRSVSPVAVVRWSVGGGSMEGRGRCRVVWALSRCLASGVTPVTRARLCCPFCGASSLGESWLKDRRKANTFRPFGNSLLEGDLLGTSAHAWAAVGPGTGRWSSPTRLGGRVRP